MEFDLVRLPGDCKDTVAEVWLPSRNETEAGAVCQFISSLPENINLEYFARGSKRSMLVRGSLPAVKNVGALIAAVYPSASLHFLDNDPVSDISENCFTMTGNYGFGGDGYLPLKHFERYRDYDPVHTILASLLDLGTDESVDIRIFLKERRRPEWLDTVLKRIKAEKQRGFVTNASMEDTGNSIGAYTPVEQYRTVDLKKASVTVLMMAAWAFVLFLFLMGMTGTMFIFLVASLLLTFIRMKMPDQMDDPWYQTDLDTLISLDPYTCYAKIMRQDGKLSRPFFFRTTPPVVPDKEIRQDVLDKRDDYARKKSEAVSEALGYLDRIVKYGFYSSGKAYSEGSDPGSSKGSDGKSPDTDKRMDYPEDKRNKGKSNKKADPIPEKKMDPERKEKLDIRYNGLNL